MKKSLYYVTFTPLDGKRSETRGKERMISQERSRNPLKILQSTYEYVPNNTNAPTPSNDHSPSCAGDTSAYR